MSKPLVPGQNAKGQFPRKANGAGWGKQAKGEGEHRPMPTVKTLRRGQPADTPRDAAGRYEPDPVKAASREEMLDFYVEVKRNGKESALNRMAAADKWLDRTEGKPKQTTEHSGPGGGPIETLTHDRLADRIARLAAAGATPGIPGEPDAGGMDSAGGGQPETDPG